ncbi:ODA1 [Acrasis kona]|uniref:ODA1 n=1 Tax=Acrasis kona TaxID=1008807 RepID=A0AAW2ZMY0_9EUKA
MDDGLASQKMKDLKSSTRIADSNTRKYKNFSDKTLKKQEIAIEKLKKDNEALKEQLASQTRNINVAQTVELGSRINKLNEITDSLIRKLNVEQKTVDELQVQIAVLDAKVKEARQDMGGVNVSKENTMMIERQIKVLENRLDKALVKFNEAIAYNKSLRDQIQNLRQERVVFDNIYKKMESELHKKQEEMAKVIEQSNQAFEEGNDAQIELSNLKLRQEQLMSNYEAEFEELDKIIKKDETLNEKMKIKEKQRRDKELMMNATGDLNESRRLGATTDHKHKLEATNAEKLKFYEDEIKKIELGTEHNIEDLIKLLSNSEDQNFSLFTYVNELNTEIEKLEEQNHDLDEEIKKCKGDGENSDAQRRKALSDLQENLNNTELMAQQYMHKYNVAMNSLNALSSGIQQMFDAVGCDASSVQESLGSSTVTESNMMTYLGMIEQRTNELIQQHLSRNHENGEDHDDTVSVSSGMLSIGPHQPFGAVRPSISPPTTGEGLSDDDDDDDEEERPLTRDELLSKTKKMMMQQQKKKKKKNTKM